MVFMGTVVARQLIAFGRLKLLGATLGCVISASRKTTNRLRAIETELRGRCQVPFSLSQDN